jgi:hypothetical protein
MTIVSFGLYSGDSLRNATPRAGQYRRTATNKRVRGGAHNFYGEVTHGERQRDGWRLRRTSRSDGSSAVRQLPVRPSDT